jgi:hypothetical protein
LTEKSNLEPLRLHHSTQTVAYLHSFPPPKQEAPLTGAVGKGKRRVGRMSGILI